MIEEKKNSKVLIIGLGEIGYHNAEYMTTKGLEIHGHDISAHAIERAVSAGVIIREAKSFAGYDRYIICVSTHNPDYIFAPYANRVYDVARRIAQEGKQGALVGIDSTIPKGTSRKVWQILGGRFDVVHVPHRYFALEKKEHGVNQVRVIGAVDELSMIHGKQFYGETLGIPLHKVRSVEVAELCKVIENSYRFLQIAFAEELKMICDGSGLDFDEVRDAVNTKWNIEILEAREGIGGHCLPKDSEMFLEFAKDAVEFSIIEAAKTIDQKYRFHVGQHPNKEPLNLVRHQS